MDLGKKHQNSTVCTTLSTIVNKFKYYLHILHLRFPRQGASLHESKRKHRQNQPNSLKLTKWQNHWISEWQRLSNPLMRNPPPNNQHGTTNSTTLRKQLPANPPARNLPSKATCWWETCSPNDEQKQQEPSNHNIKPTGPTLIDLCAMKLLTQAECNLWAGLQALLPNRTFMWTAQWKQPVSRLMTNRNPYNLQLLEQPKWNISPTQPSIHTTTHPHIHKHIHKQSCCLPHPKPSLTSITSCLRVVRLKGHSDRGPTPRPQHVLLVRVGRNEAPPILRWHSHIFLHGGYLVPGISPQTYSQWITSYRKLLQNS